MDFQKENLLTVQVERNNENPTPLGILTAQNPLLPQSTRIIANQDGPITNYCEESLLGTKKSLDVEDSDYSLSSATIEVVSAQTDTVNVAAAQLQSPDTTFKKPRNGDPGSHLFNLLAKDADGIIITRSFITNNGFLNQQARKFLVRRIIHYELTKALGNLPLHGTEQLQEFTISTSTFVTYSNEIAALFPSEDPKGYFNRFRVVDGVRKEATGRLWEHYNYMKTVLREQGVLAKPSRKEPLFEPLTFDDFVTKKLNWLETNAGPLETVLDAWRATFDARRELLLKQNLTVFDYYSKFLSLRIQEGVYLIQSDFAKLYPNEATALTCKWDLIKSHLISKIKSSKAIKDVEEKALTLLLPTFPKDKQVAVVFHLMTAVLPQSRIGLRKKSNTDKPKNNDSRVTLQDRRESFTLIVPTAAQLDAELQRVKVSLQKSGQTFQPTPIIVGGIVDIESCYVAVNDTVYKTNSYMEAIDLAFKIFFVTHSAYPERSRSVWQLIEKGIFDIQDQPGKCPSSIEFLAGELRAIVKNNCGTA